ncbi:MAG: hypothetical protein LIO97_13205 [Tannerellaceae bacterium]|nr:hypothetical protein [Tannerellaceae bacterium]
MTLAGCTEKENEPLYLNPELPAEKRVQDLIKRMTLEEKVAQMSQYVGVEHMKAAEKEVTLEEMKESHAQGFYPNLHSTELIEMTRQGLIGSFLHVVTAREANLLQSYAMESRLKIPVLIGIDAIHGTGLYHGQPSIRHRSGRLPPLNRNSLNGLRVKQPLKCALRVHTGHSRQT